MKVPSIVMSAKYVWAIIATIRNPMVDLVVGGSFARGDGATLYFSLLSGPDKAKVDTNVQLLIRRLKHAR